MGLNKRLISSEAAGGLGEPTDNFDIVTYTGNGSTKSITSLDFQPDFVWAKSRSIVVDHAAFDSVRGAQKYISPSTTGAEGTYSTVLTSFDSNGFTVGNNAGVNQSGANYVAWCWKGGGAAVSNTDGSITSQVSANQDAGFSIVKFTSNSPADLRVGHGLSSTPELIIYKRLDGGGEWYVVSSEISGYYLRLNSNAGQAVTSPYSSYFASGALITSFTPAVTQQIAYCFHSVDGYQKVGSYTGNSTTKTVTTGFRPRFLMVKGTSSFRNWCVFDTARPNDVVIYPNLANQETDYDRVLFTPTDTGFQLGAADDFNASGNTYIYLAIA